MAVQWLRVLDAIVGVSEIARAVKGRPTADEELASNERRGSLEARLAAVVVAALKEAFDRDHLRFELEREQIEGERERVQRAMRIDLAQQVGQQEVGRLRLLSSITIASWLGTLFFSARFVSGAPGARVALGVGWLLLLAALAMSFVAQSAVTQALSRTDEDDFASSGTAGALAPWLLVLGLAVIGVGILFT